MRPYFKFMGFLAENGIKHGDVADLLGISVSTFSKKINRNNTDFTASEIKCICEHYKISADIYFFDLEVAR